MNGGVARLPKPGTIREFARARLYEPPIGRELIEQLFAEAGLGVARRISNFPAGWRTSVVLVTAEDSKFVVRRYPDRWSDPAILHEQSILRALAQSDFPSPRLIDLGKGSSLWVYGQDRYSVLSYEEGTTLSGYFLGSKRIERLLREAGQTLAAFHEALDGFTPDGSHHLGIDRTSGAQRRDMAWHERAVAAMTGSEVAQTFDVRSSSELLKRLTELDEVVVSADLPQVIVHGDFGLHNIIFRTDGVGVVHDFELSRLDLRLVDVVSSLSRLRPQFRSHLLTGLVATDGLMQRELDLLGEVWEWYKLRGAIQSADAYHRLGGEHRRAAAARRLAEARRVQRGEEAIPNRSEVLR